MDKEEQLNLNKYRVEVTSNRRKAPEKLQCPRCRYLNWMLDHNEQGECKYCNLRMHVAGNCLTVWW